MFSSFVASTSAPAVVPPLFQLILSRSLLLCWCPRPCSDPLPSLPAPLPFILSFCWSHCTPAAAIQGQVLRQASQVSLVSHAFANRPATHMLLFYGGFSFTSCSAAFPPHIPEPRPLPWQGRAHFCPAPPPNHRPAPAHSSRLAISLSAKIHTASSTRPLLARLLATAPCQPHTRHGRRIHRCRP